MNTISVQLFQNLRTFINMVELYDLYIVRQKNKQMMDLYIENVVA